MDDDDDDFMQEVMRQYRDLYVLYLNTNIACKIAFAVRFSMLQA